MTPVEDDITRRLHAAAERIIVAPETVVQLELEPEEGHPNGREAAQPVTILPPPPGRHRRLAPLAVAAAFLVAVALVGAHLVSDDVDPAATAAPASGLTLLEPVAPWSDDPPAWVGETRAARADRDRDGTWVTGAIGIVGDDGTTTSPIRISVFDGTEHTLRKTTGIELDGEPMLESLEDDWRLLATPSPTDSTTTRILVSGRADAPLVEVLEAVQIVEIVGSGVATYHLDSLPDGYEEVVAPILQADLGPQRPAIAGEGGRVAVYDISEWVDPRLVTMLSGGTPMAVDAAGLAGWTVVDHPIEHLDAIASFVWSPAPGVVFEAVSDDPDHTVEMLAELAATVTVEPFDEWQERHDDD